MFELGLTPERIADLCRAPLRKIRRTINAALIRDPELIGRRILVHDQPALPRKRPLLTWHQRYNNLCWFVETTGRLPRQDGSTWERQCHGFLYQQRHQYYAGQLSVGQVNH